MLPLHVNTHRLVEAGRESQISHVQNAIFYVMRTVANHQVIQLSAREATNTRIVLP